MNLGYLQKIGLTPGEIKVYKALLEIGTSPLNKIHQKTAIERRNIYDILNKLTEKGLVSYTVEKGKKTFQITHPKKIISYLEEKKHELDEVEKEIQPHIVDILKVFNESKLETRAEVYRGNEAIKTLLTEMLDHKKSYWMGGNSFEEYKAVPKNLQVFFKHWMDKRSKKKHLMCDLVSHGTYLDGLEPNNIATHKKMYYKYCTLPKGMYVPMVLIIFGNKVAQVQWGDQSFAFVIESEKIQKSYMEYFNHFWKNPW